MRVWLTLILATLILVPSARAAEIRTATERVYLNPTDLGRGYYDLVLHTIAFAADPGETVELTGLSLVLSDADGNRLERDISVARIVAETGGMREMAGAGLGVFLHAQLLDREGLAGMFGRPVELAQGAVLAENEALLATRLHLSVNFRPDTLAIIAQTRSPDGRTTRMEKHLPVEVHESPIRYTLPLEGSWLMTALPSIESHHRLNPPTEFAVDFFMPGPDGRGRASEGDARVAENFLGYGAPVLAAADGEVVHVVDDVVQDRAALMPAEGESLAEAGRRISRYNMQRYAADFGRAAAGNIVVIRHEADGVVEYSAYGHLQAGSVRVAVGDQVTRGQVIAGVGDTGDSAAVHLHFQVNREADVFFSASLPVTFDNLEPVRRGQDAGVFVRARE